MSSGDDLQPCGEAVKDDVFGELHSEYMRIVAEQSPEFLDEKRAIEDSFAQQLKIIENFRRSRREVVLQEGMFMQQADECSKGGA